MTITNFIYFSPACQHLLYDLREVLEVSLALHAVLMRQRLNDAVDLRAAERRCGSVTVLISSAAFETMLAYLVE